MDSESSLNSCNLEFLHNFPKMKLDDVDWDEFTQFKITSLPPQPIDYINDMKRRLEEKE